MKNYIHWLGLPLLFCFSFIVSAKDTAGNTTEWQAATLGTPPADYVFPIYSNHSWPQANAQIRYAVILQHGVERNADNYYATGMALLKASGKNPEEFLLIAPHFSTQSDQKEFILDRMPIWSVQGWISGENAINLSHPISSLQVLDDILTRLNDRTQFPSLTHITIVGHSGGGQLVQRYAVLNHLDKKIRANNIKLRYVVANPSSYLYFTNERPTTTSTSGFAPYDKQLCPDYDTYRYGVEHMIPYAQDLSGMALFDRYAKRDVTYLLGTADNNPNHRVLDNSCPAKAQGTNRYARGHAYINYEKYLATSRQLLLKRQAFDVIDVGHQSDKMLESQCAAKLIFGLPARKNNIGRTCRMN